MKKFTFKSALTALIAALTFIGSAPCSAEEFSDNPNLYGTWVLESMQYEGEKLIQCRSNGYTQIKYYGKDGEYACVEIRRARVGSSEKFFIHSSPHESGYKAFSLKGNMYSEMGRAPIKDAIIFADKNTIKGKWKNRHDVWKRIELPKALLDNILAVCRATRDSQSKEIQDMMKLHLMK